MECELQAEAPEVDANARARRAPEVVARGRFGETEERVDDAVVAAEHAAELRFKGVEGAAEREERQARALALEPRHRTPNHERLRLEALLRGSLDVGRRRCIGQFFVITAAPTIGMILPGLTQRIKCIEVMYPCLLYTSDAADE